MIIDMGITKLYYQEFYSTFYLQIWLQYSDMKKKKKLPKIRKSEIK